MGTSAYNRLATDMGIEKTDEFFLYLMLKAANQLSANKFHTTFRQ